jgi:6-hydroxycyclohex-1-ene-1-carbonyl-CoA dehydrogenase
MTAPSEIRAWQMEKPEAPLVARTLPVPALGPGDVLIEVAGCGLCHTDLSFLYGGVGTKHAPPLTLGHEISGRVVATGDAMNALAGKDVLVPAVLPCGECALCKAGERRICRAAVMPGNDIDGGFASHIKVPGRYVCPVDLTGSPAKLELWQLAVVADAVTTPYQAAERVGIAAGDTVIVIGVGGIGTYGVLVAAARGANVVALDVDQAKLDRMAQHGAKATVNVKGLGQKEVKEAVKNAVKQAGGAQVRWKILEMSGTAAGQDTAFNLLNFGATMAVVGFTMDKVNVRVSNLMAFDAKMVGNWGCDAALYPQIVESVVKDQITIAPFVKRFPLDEINQVIEAARAHKLTERAVLVPGA